MRGPSDGHLLHDVLRALLPLQRSLTGPGVVATLDGLGEQIAHVRVASGTPVHDWTVPDEWTLRTARLTGPDGTVIADAAVNPLHVLGYSVAVDAEMELDELRDHLHVSDQLADAIPFRTSYYSPRWGFCISQATLDGLAEGTYRAVIDADLEPGHMTYGQRVVAGRTDTEIVVSSHICHPGMANDNLSGNVVAAALADALADGPTPNLTWRFIWVPGTIGEITWLATNPDVLPRVAGGIVLSGVGDPGALRWKRSRDGDALVDRAARVVLRDHAAAGGTVGDERPWEPWGYGERQFNSLGVGIPAGRLSRTPFGTYPQYHTSADDASFVTPAALGEALDVALALARAVDGARRYVNLKPHGEARLGPRGLYPSMGGPTAKTKQLALLWVLGESDGATDLIAIADRSGIALVEILEAATALVGTDLLALADVGPDGGGGIWSGDAPTAAPWEECPALDTPTADDEELRRRLHAAIPGGAHTYAKGDDQFPASAPPLLVSGRGARVTDVHGREYVEYGGGLRANVLGHAHPAVVHAVSEAVARGTNFVRPGLAELEAAEDLLDFIGRPDWMVKFVKNGSDANDGAVRLARAVTGRDKVAYCHSQPFFSVGDWFIGTTAMRAGIPSVVSDLAVGFDYGDVDSLEQVLVRGDVAAVVMEAAKYADPPEGWLDAVAERCRAHGTLFVLDEMITGFRWPGRTALQAYGVEPDLVTYGKGMGNGIAVSALTGRPEIMGRGGLLHDEERVFLLSTTHGAEHVGLAAARAVMSVCREQDAGTTMARVGAELMAVLNGISDEMGVRDHLAVDGLGQNLIFTTADHTGAPSQHLRALAMQELIAGGVIGPSLVLSAAHGPDEIADTATAWRATASVYARALEAGTTEGLLRGAPTSPVFRRFNTP